MENNQWRYLNTMPKAFRQKTTPAFKIRHQSILSVMKEKQIHRDMEEAIEVAKKAPEYTFLDDAENDKYTYTTLEGINYLGRIGARQVFINICRQIDSDLAAEFITVWNDDKKVWETLQYFVANHKK